MERILVPASRLEAIRDRFTKLQKKSDAFKCEIGQTIYVPHPDKPFVKVPMKEIFVEGSYKVGDWRFVATLEHTDKGNILNRADTELEVPERFLTCEPICEHCHTHRDRLYTYIIYNNADDTFRQVGRSCLKDYTGLDADTIAYSIAFYAALRDFAEDDEYLERSDDDYCEVDRVLSVSMQIIKKYGYVKVNGGGVTTAERVAEALKDPAYESYTTELVGYRAWLDKKVENPGTMSEYIHNVNTIVQLEYAESKHWALLASSVYIYFRDKERAASSQWVGNVGDTVVIQVAEKRVLFVNLYSYGYNKSNSTSVFEIIDTKGNIYKWSTNKDVVEGMYIKAVVKDHDMYKGIKQTVLTRGKILTEEEV